MKSTGKYDLLSGSKTGKSIGLLLRTKWEQLIFTLILTVCCSFLNYNIADIMFVDLLRK